MKIPTYLYIAAFALVASVEAKEHIKPSLDPRIRVAEPTTVAKREADAKYHPKPSLDPRIRVEEKREAKKGHHEDTYDPRLKVVAATTLETVKRDAVNAEVTAA